MKLKSGKSIGLNPFYEPKPKSLFEEERKKPSVERDRSNEPKKKSKKTKIKTIINELMNEKSNY
tara:strand:+ start:1216 stop:1407 length:192 start_codon:yes stop_codon:yes gene_type:complete